MNMLVSLLSLSTELFNFSFSFLDERLKDLFLMQSPLPMIGIVSTYLFFVNGRGQDWMKDRKPFELNSIINVFNVVQIFLNLYMGFGVSK